MSDQAHPQAGSKWFFDNGTLATIVSADAETVTYRCGNRTTLRRTTRQHFWHRARRQVILPSPP